MTNGEINRANNPVGSIMNCISSILNDSDTILILAMVLLLSRDGADKMLILALIYILG